MKSTIRKSLLVAVIGLVMTAISGFRNDNGAVVRAAATTSCDSCIQAVQSDPAVCRAMIKRCGVDWFVDPCEFSPGALCQCATGCDPLSLK